MGALVTIINSGPEDYSLRWMSNNKGKLLEEGIATHMTPGVHSIHTSTRTNLSTLQSERSLS